MAWLCLGLALASPASAALDIRDDYSALNAERPVRSETRYLVLHTTEGGDSSAIREVKRRGLANYLVLRDGSVRRVIEKHREARHAGRSMWNGAEDLDRVSVGIEVVGHHHRPITRAQEVALKELLRQLQSIYGLADDAVLAHAMVAYGEPNRWHEHPHRGRKRCGMLFATVSMREDLGLTRRPASDPDVRAGRLVEADPELAAILYGHYLARGKTPFAVAGPAYAKASTVYVFPKGARRRGDEIEDWTEVPAGTWVLLDQGAG